MRTKERAKGATALRAALYARYSGDIQNDRSIERQFADLEKAAERHGLVLDKRHYYCDRGESGSSLFDRPGLTRELMDAAKQQQFDVVLCEHTDRLARRGADLLMVASELEYSWWRQNSNIVRSRSTRRPLARFRSFSWHSMAIRTKTSSTSYGFGLRAARTTWRSKA